jgi:hypothetical protein
MVAHASLLLRTLGAAMVILLSTRHTKDMLNWRWSQKQKRVREGGPERALFQQDHHQEPGATPAKVTLANQTARARITPHEPPRRVDEAPHAPRLVI